jgi:hypothetical protein
MRRLLLRSVLWCVLLIAAGIVEILRVVPRTVITLGPKGVLAVAAVAVLWSSGGPLARQLPLEAIGLLGSVIAPWAGLALAVAVLWLGLWSPTRRRSWPRIRTRA